MSCRSDLKFPGHDFATGKAHSWAPAMGEPLPYVWADITWLLYKRGVSWGYFVGRGELHRRLRANIRLQGKSDQPASRTPSPASLACPPQGQLDNIRPNTEFFDAAAAGNLPAVSWVMPDHDQQRAPTRATSPPGQAWVTKIVNAVMQGPADQWNHTAIFVTWDDWGGFYDHVRASGGGSERMGATGARVHDQPVGRAGAFRLIRT